MMSNSENVERLAKLTKAQLRVLSLCANKLTATVIAEERVRGDVLKRLSDSGLITYYPHAKEPHWSTTSAGWAEITSDHARRTSRRQEVLR